MKKGLGMNTSSSFEGIHYHNFFGTYLVGPFLILNPLFTKHLLKIMGVENPSLAFEKDILDAYNFRLSEFKDSKIKF